MPSQMWPNSLQRKFAGGPSCDTMLVFEPVSNSGTPGDAEQSSSLVIMMIARYASGRRKPWFSAGAGAPVGAERAQDGGELVLEAAAGLTERRDAGEHVGQGAGVVPLVPAMSEMYVAPAWRPLAVQVPRGVYWKMPCLPPVVSQPATEPSPAPMSDEMTATWMLGSPWGALCNVVMNVGKLRFRLSCDSRIDDESSTRNNMSTFRLIVCWKFLPKVISGFSSGVSRLRAWHAHSTGTTAARPTQRSTRNKERPVMGASSKQSGRWWR